MAKIQILVGSVNGRAVECAETVSAILSRLGHKVWINGAPSPQDLLRDANELLLVCCSTTGEGELPRGLYPLYLALEDGAVGLKNRRYGVIALGDSRYSYFAQAGSMLENALYTAGGKPVGEICKLDARIEHNQPLAAAKWAVAWSDLLVA